MTIPLQKITKNPILTVSIYDLCHSSQVLGSQDFRNSYLLDNRVIW